MLYELRAFMYPVNIIPSITSVLGSCNPAITYFLKLIWEVYKVDKTLLCPVSIYINCYDIILFLSDQVCIHELPCSSLSSVRVLSKLQRTPTFDLLYSARLLQ